WWLWPKVLGVGQHKPAALGALLGQWRIAPQTLCSSASGAKASASSNKVVPVSGTPVWVSPDSDPKPRLAVLPFCSKIRPPKSSIFEDTVCREGSTSGSVFLGNKVPSLLRKSNAIRPVVVTGTPLTVKLTT